MSASQSLICKGVHVIQAQKWVDRHLGSGACARLASEVVDPANRDAWRLILPSNKYQLEDLFRVLTAVSGQTNISVEHMTTEIASANAENDLKTIYRVFLRIAKPVRVLAFMPEIWKSYFQFGVIEIVQNEPGAFEMACSGIPARYRDWIIGGWKGFLPVTIHVAGGKSARCEVVNDAGGTDAAGLKIRIRARYTEA
jgi:hypothetical protein